MKPVPRVLPVDIPLCSLSDSGGEHEQGQIDETKNSFKNSYKSQGDRLFLSRFNGQLQFERHGQFSEIKYDPVYVFSFLSIFSAYFPPLELKETLGPPTNDFGKVQCVFTSARSVRACLQLLCCPVS